MEDKMKKSLAIILVIALCASVAIALCACNLNDGKIRIEFYSTMGKSLENVANQYIAQFEKVYPNIKVKHTVLTGDYKVLVDRLQKELNNNRGPALAYCYPDHVAAYGFNKVVALDDYINSTEVIPAGSVYGNTKEVTVGYSAKELNEDQGGFFESFFNEGKLVFGDSSKTYTLPFAKSSEVMYYNKTFFDTNNLKLPTHWWCTDECPADCDTSMDKLCAKIRTIDPNSRPFGYDADDNFFITLAEQAQTLPENQGQKLYTQATGNKYLFNNEVMRDLMKKLNDWYQKKYFITKRTNGTSYTSDNFKNADGKLNQSYMCIGSTGGATYQVPSSDKFEVGIAEIPQLNPANPKVILQGPDICILRNRNNRTDEQLMASWLFVKYMTTSIPFQANFSMTSGYVPIFKGVTEDPTYVDSYLNTPANLKTDEKIAALAVKQCLAQKDHYYYSPAFDGSSKAREQVGILLAACLKDNDGDGGKTIDTLIQERFNQAIKTCELYVPSSK